jgi:hypothetical protein
VTCLTTVNPKQRNKPALHENGYYDIRFASSHAIGVHLASDKKRGREWMLMIVITNYLT